MWAAFLIGRNDTAITRHHPNNRVSAVASRVSPVANHVSPFLAFNHPAEILPTLHPRGCKHSK